LSQKKKTKKNLKKLTSDLDSSTPITLRSTLIKKPYFCKKNGSLSQKKEDKKFFLKTNIRFGFLDPDNPSVNPYNIYIIIEKNECD
jgi:hypothetical protein